MVLRRLRERIAALARVSTDQLQATKISCYEEGQFFGPHYDAPRATKRPSMGWINYWRGRPPPISSLPQMSCASCPTDSAQSGSISMT
eukprot:1580533-Prymnesium_polylepis.1